MGNFIAFFRLSRKATYLQACLMHAHFAKVESLPVKAALVDIILPLMYLRFLLVINCAGNNIIKLTV
jgi:hypothetical protein